MKPSHTLLSLMGSWHDSMYQAVISAAWDEANGQVAGFHFLSFSLHLEPLREKITFHSFC